MSAITVEAHEVDGLPVWVAVAPYPFGTADLLNVVALLPDGAFCTDVEVDGQHVYMTWIG